MAAPFQHQPLHRARREIRLLKLLPRNKWPNDFLPTCSVFHACIDQCPPYLALSYVWGDQRDRKEILANGCTLEVTKNLFEALIGIVGSETMVIWIDAICINQADDEEKGWQVALMGDIYQNTSEVLAWLGPSADNSDNILDHLNVLGSMAEACGLSSGIDPCTLVWKEILRTWPNEWNPPEFVSNLKSWLIQVRGLEILLYAISGLKRHKYLIDLDDLDHFFQRPWWERIWVLQEISLPEQAQFVCGPRRISRNRLLAVYNAYSALGNSLSLHPQLLSSLTYPAKVQSLIPSNIRLMLSMSELYKKKVLGLAELLRAISFGPTAYNHTREGPTFLSTDPRDKIFALLNLINDKEELGTLGIYPDYTKRTEEIYTSVMIAMLRQGHVSLLSQACGVKRPGGLRSWVPDWSTSTLRTLQISQDYLDFGPEFMACGSNQGRRIKFEYEKDRMLVLGTICDEVLCSGFVSRLPGPSKCAWPLMWLRGVEKLMDLTKGSYSDSKVRLQTTARVAHAGMSIGTGKFVERARVFPKTVDILEKLNLSGIEDENFIELQDTLLQDALKSEGFLSIADSYHMYIELIRISQQRSPFATSNGRLGIGSMEAKKGDVVALISGAQTPFILRPVGERFMIVSEAYVDGIMDGEAAEDGQWDYIELE